MEKETVRKVFKIALLYHKREALEQFCESYFELVSKDPNWVAEQYISQLERQCKVFESVKFHFFFVQTEADAEKLIKPMDALIVFIQNDKDYQKYYKQIPAQLEYIIYKNIYFAIDSWQDQGQLGEKESLMNKCLQWAEELGGNYIQKNVTDIVQNFVIKDHKFMKTVFAMFQELDADKNGVISLQELGEVAKKLGREMQQNEIEETLKDLDTDHDGVISFKEFLNWWRGGDTQRSAVMKGVIKSKARLMQGVKNAAPELQKLFAAPQNITEQWNEGQLIVGIGDLNNQKVQTWGSIEISAGLNETKSALNTALGLQQDEQFCYVTFGFHVKSEQNAKIMIEQAQVVKKELFQLIGYYSEDFEFLFKDSEYSKKRLDLEFKTSGDMFYIVLKFVKSLISEVIQDDYELREFYNFFNTLFPKNIKQTVSLDFTSSASFQDIVQNKIRAALEPLLDSFKLRFSLKWNQMLCNLFSNYYETRQNYKDEQDILFVPMLLLNCGNVEVQYASPTEIKDYLVIIGDFLKQILGDSSLPRNPQIAGILDQLRQGKVPPGYNVYALLKSILLSNISSFAPNGLNLFNDNCCADKFHLFATFDFLSFDLRISIPGIGKLIEA